MNSIPTMRDIEDLETMAHGRPDRLAKLTLMKRDYKEIGDFAFADSHHEFADTPSEGYVARLKAEAETGDKMAELRYELMRDRYEHRHNGRNEQFEDARVIYSKLRHQLAEGSEVTERDVRAAEYAARKMPTPQFTALYAKTKQALESQQSEVTE